MLNLFKTSNGYLYHAFKRQSKTLAPISQLASLAKTLDSDSRPGSIANGLEDLQSSQPTNQDGQSLPETKRWSDFVESSKRIKSTVQISHPWAEWVNFMELLIKRGYFDGDGNPFNKKNGELGSKEANSVRTACLNFGRDHSGHIRYLSKKDIQVIVVCGCPSTDRKVVNAGKRLRAHVGIDEGHVCSSCILRGNCERAYGKAHEDVGGRTVDVMRILLTYGLDPVTDTVENKPCLNKFVKAALRRLLKEMVECSTKEAVSYMCNPESLRRSAPDQDHLSPQKNGCIYVPVKQGDWRCPKCNFRNFARNIKCLRCNSLFLERLEQLREDPDHLPLKKGDWICEKCNFMNFAKNARCLLCKEKPQKRQLQSGEWECESCNYINFRRNMVCMKCDHRRPKALSTQAEHGNDGYHNCNGLKHLKDKNDVANSLSVRTR